MSLNINKIGLFLISILTTSINLTDAQNNSLQSRLINEISNIDHALIEKRWMKIGKRYDNFDLPEKWQIDESFFSSKRLTRRKKYFEFDNNAENIYLIKITLPVEFEKFIEYETNINVRNIDFKTFKSQTKNCYKLEDDGVWLMDYFLSTMKLMHIYIYSKFPENGEFDKCQDSSLPNEYAITKIFTYLNFTHAEVCALNWLLAYLYPDIYLHFLLIFPEVIQIEKSTDQTFKITFLFDFNLPDLVEKDKQCETQFISHFDALVDNLGLDLVTLLNRVDKIKMISSTMYSKCESFFDDKTQFHFLFDAFLKYIKIEISIESILCLHLIEFGIFEDEDKIENKYIKDSLIYKKYNDSYEECKTLKNKQEISINFNINDILYLYFQMDLGRLYSENKTLKAQFKTLFVATNKLYTLYITE
ncbi:hypothetical protein COBT_002256 [Conglomerata obtusa]